MLPAVTVGANPMCLSQSPAVRLLQSPNQSVVGAAGGLGVSSYPYHLMHTPSVVYSNPSLVGAAATVTAAAPVIGQNITVLPSGLFFCVMF